jgi:hypothetical protein
MKKSIIERNIVVVLFLLVLIVFSFAEKDSRKLDRLYSKKMKTSQVTAKESKLAASEPTKTTTVLTTRN